MPSQTEEPTSSSPTSKDPKAGETDLQLSESAKAGDQGILFPPMGSHETNPFARPRSDPASESPSSTSTADSPQAPDSPVSSAGQGNAGGE